MLQGASAADFADRSKFSTLAKSFTEGRPCLMTCHLVNVENNLGRSTVIDLNAKGPSKFRQVDHRSIDYIIFKNTKYVLKKGAKPFTGDSSTDADSDGKKSVTESKWKSTDLQIGNWFSGTRYFKAIKVNGDKVICRSQGKDIEISRDILENQMHNANVYEEEEKIPLTQVATLLSDADSKAFTVCFTTKVDEKQVRDRLAECTPAQLKNSKFATDLAKELMVGKECTLVGRLSRAEGKLGRSLVIDLPTAGYRQVDHRTLRHLIINNTKYIVNRR